MNPLDASVRPASFFMHVMKHERMSGGRRQLQCPVFCVLASEPDSNWFIATIRLDAHQSITCARHHVSLFDCDQCPSVSPTPLRSSHVAEKFVEVVGAGDPSLNPRRSNNISIWPCAGLALLGQTDEDFEEVVHVDDHFKTLSPQIYSAFPPRRPSDAGADRREVCGGGGCDGAAGQRVAGPRVHLARLRRHLAL